MEKNEVSAKDSFLGDLVEQVDPFAVNQEDPFASTEETPVEQKEEVAEVKEEVLPFHKLKADPKFQKFLAKEIAKQTESAKPVTATEQFVHDVNEEDSLVETLTNIIGNDTPEKVRLLKQFEKKFSQLDEKASKAEEAARIVEESKRAAELEKESVAFLEEGFDQIEESYGIDLSSNSPTAVKTRNDFIDFIKRVAPKTRDGEIAEYPDLMETFEVFKEIRTKQATNSRAKDLASRGMSRSTEASQATAPRPTWDNIDRLLGLDK